MQLRHILAAADESEEGRAAVLAAASLLRRPGGRLSVLKVEPGLGEDGARARLLEGLKTMVSRQLQALATPPPVDLVLASGIPDIEIGRYAETEGVDLTVVGRKRRTSMRRLMAGDTADAVARRSRTPCLFVPAGQARFELVLAALDGTERGHVILRTALNFARAAELRLRAVTVEPPEPEPCGETPPVLTARSARLADAMESLRRSRSRTQDGWDPLSGHGGSLLAVHRGEIVDEVLAEVEQSGADVLIVGYHRGGPAGVIDAGSIARRLLHQATCAVLTIPL